MFTAAYRLFTPTIRDNGASLALIAKVYDRVKVGILCGVVSVD